VPTAGREVVPRAGDLSGPVMAAAAAAAAAAMEQEAEATCLQSFELYESESVSIPMRWFIFCSCLRGAGRIRPFGSYGSGEGRAGVRVLWLQIIAVHGS
jgi:hypothetical protein